MVRERLPPGSDEGNYSDGDNSTASPAPSQPRKRVGKPDHPNDRMTEVRIYTDGACRGNPGPGGWGVWLASDDTEKELYGGVMDTTNNRMELTAAIEGLAALTRTCQVAVYTDSKYVQRGITEWISGWKQRGWKTASRKPVKNDDLWRRLDELVADQNVDWRWVKGHSGDPGNERADELANRGIDEMLAAGPD